MASHQSLINQLPKSEIINFRCQGHVIHDGPGTFRSALIGFQGCCEFVLRDNRRELFKMAPAFNGSFFLEIGFINNLTIDLSGSEPAHIHIVYQPA